MQRVLVVAEHAIDVGLLEDEFKNLHRVTAEADVAGFAGLLDFPQGRERLVDDLLHGHELDVVAENDIEVIRAETVQGNIDALGDAFGREIEMRQVVATEFGAQRVALPRHAFERDAEKHLAHAAAVERRRIDKVEPALQRDAHAAERFVESDVSKLSAEGAGAETKNRQVKIGVSETTSLHRRRGKDDAKKLNRAAAHREQDVGPQRLIGGLDGEHVIGTFDVLIKIPFENRLKLQRRTRLGEHGAELLPNGRFAFLRVGIIGGDAHRLAMIDGDRAQDRAQDLRDRDDPGGKIERDNLGVRPALGGGGVIAIGDEDFRVMARPREDAQDVRMSQRGLEHDAEFQDEARAR